MSDRNSEPVHADLVENIGLETICTLYGVKTDWVVELVSEGIVLPEQDHASRWVFSSTSMKRIGTAKRLHQDLGVNIAGIALVLELLDERESLRKSFPEVMQIFEFDDTDSQ